MNNRTIAILILISIGLILPVTGDLFAAPSGSERCHVQPDNEILIAAFFPGNSTFSHSRFKKSVSRKKFKKQRMEKRNNALLNRFYKREEALLSALTEINKGNKSMLYWQLGEALSKETTEQRRMKNYPDFLYNSLGERLDISVDTIQETILFYQTWPVLASVPLTLTWDHLSLLIRIEDYQAREFYRKETTLKNLSPVQLESMINENRYETVKPNDDTDETEQ